MLKLRLDITQEDIDAAVAQRTAGKDYAAGCHCPAARALGRALAERGVAVERYGCGFSRANVYERGSSVRADSESSRDLLVFTEQFDESWNLARPVPVPAVIELEFPTLDA